MTNFALEEALAADICRHIYSVRLCVERWAKEMIIESRKRHVYDVFSYILEFHRENTNS